MEWFTYLLKVSACSALFFAFYLVVLSKLTFFRANRFYLLASLLLSFVIPALHVEIEKVLPPVIMQAGTTELQATLQAQPLAAVPVATAPGVNWAFWSSLGYVLVVIGLLIIALWRTAQVLKHTRAYTRVDGLKLIHKNAGFTNCSFFNYVFIDQQNLTEEELALLLKHEEVHAKQFHSADKLLLLLAKAVLWFNPVIYYYDKALEKLHEFEADLNVSESFGTRSYASLLLTLVVKEQTGPLVHSFVKSPIKERIKMLYQSKSKNMKKLSYVLALPIVSGLVWGFAVNVVYAQEKIITGQNQQAKEIATKKVNGVRTENIASKNDVVEKANGKAAVAGVEIHAVNGTPIQDQRVTLSGQQISVADRAVSLRGEGTIDRVGVQNNVAVVGRASVAPIAVTNGRTKVSGVSVGANNVATGISSSAVDPSTRIVGVSRMDGVAIAGRAENSVRVNGQATVNMIRGTGASSTIGINDTGYLLISDQKIALVINKNTTRKQLEQYQSQLKEKNIDLKITKIDTGANDKITYVEISVDCNDGFRGAVSGSTKDGNIGFYRSYVKNAASPFGVGSGEDN